MHALSFSLLPALMILISNVDMVWGVPVKLNSTLQGFRVLTPQAIPHLARFSGALSYGVARRAHPHTHVEGKGRRDPVAVGGVGYTPTSDSVSGSGSTTTKTWNTRADRPRSTSLWRWRGVVAPSSASAGGRRTPGSSFGDGNEKEEEVQGKAEGKAKRQPDQGDPRNTVVVDSEHEYCLIVPLSMSTDIGESEQPGGTTTYCSQSARYSQEQGVFSPDFWSVVEYATGVGRGGGRWAQLTGCINPETLDRLDPDDAGGQYDSSGGEGGRGNPEGSVCRGFNHYVELIEPAGARACIRCCDDEDDCPVHRDTEGCPAVIPGNYFTCDVDGGEDDDGDIERLPAQIGAGGDEGEDGVGDDDDDASDDRR
ncbi:hypothetical protein BJ165DRAFT_1390011 [Panaeolus papilionaceus]|nr:hypothetical protein BJ165DRAFT_1390011 [Panaeolus papilionaceus]